MKLKIFLSAFGYSILMICFLLLACSIFPKAQSSLKHGATVAEITRYEVKQGYEKMFSKAIGKYVKQANTKDFNIMAEGYNEEENPLVLWIIERWKNKDELDKMRSDETFKQLTLLSQTMLTKPAKVISVKDLEPLSKDEWRRTESTDDKPITIMLFVDSKAGTEDKFKEVYHTAMPAFRSEPGVINYQLSQLEEDSTQFVTYEKFRSEEAFQFHLKFPPIEPVIDYLNKDIKQQPFQSGLHRLIQIATDKS